MVVATADGGAVVTLVSMYVSPHPVANAHANPTAIAPTTRGFGAKCPADRLITT